MNGNGLENAVRLADICRNEIDWNESLNWFSTTREKEKEEKQRERERVHRAHASSEHYHSRALSFARHERRQEMKKGRYNSHARVGIAGKMKTFDKFDDSRKRVSTLAAFATWKMEYVDGKGRANRRILRSPIAVARVSVGARANPRIVEFDCIRAFYVLETRRFTRIVVSTLT